MLNFNRHSDKNILIVTLDEINEDWLDENICKHAVIISDATDVLIGRMHTNILLEQTGLTEDFTEEELKRVEEGKLSVIEILENEVSYFSLGRIVDLKDSEESDLVDWTQFSSTKPDLIYIDFVSNCYSKQDILRHLVSSGEIDFLFEK